LEDLAQDQDVERLFGWDPGTLLEASGEVKAKDAEILALKEQVASLQRVLAHHRDSDSGVGS
jgi:hypothetical protein